MRDIQHANLESQLTRAELQALKMQIHPHFLFNTLNGISELMHRDVDAAERMLSHLSDLLRTTIDRSGDRFVRLEDELAFVEHYLEIEQTRFADRLRVQMEVDPGVRDALVPSFVLQPFVENAVKHGAARRSRPVTVTIGALRMDGRLRMSVTDDGPGLPSAPVPGLGISNVSRRLECLFGDDFELRLGEGGPGFAVTIDIPLLSEPEPVAV
jgi:LytS/YehU family sensor histidine kinase